MADWDEVKRLASDFQKVQLSSTTQKLSERNCVEIVTWLMEKKMIDIIFTSDGKEYITPAHLIREIQDELYISGGRLNLVVLSKMIGVDLAHIQTHLNAVLKNQKGLHYILGQLVDSTYITRIVGEINEKLNQQGQINISDLTIQYDLPSEFLQHQVLERYLGTLLTGKQDKNDPKMFFTESFIAKSIVKIRGSLHGLTKPTTVSSILSNIDVSEKLFFSLFDQASPCGSLTSRLAGAQFIPNIYSKSQNEWVFNFYKQNGYLEFDALTRLGISDYKTYLKKHFGNEKITYLNSCLVSQNIIERLEIDIDECILSKTYLDLQNNVPSVLNDKDVKLLLDNVLSNQKKQQTVIIDNTILSRGYVDQLFKCCEELIKTKAKSVVDSGKYQQYQTDLLVHNTSTSKVHKSDFKLEEQEEKVDKRDERRKKAAGGKSGGGTQGRETKTKSAKKKGSAGAKIIENDDLEVTEKKKSLEIVSSETLATILMPKLEDEGLEDLCDTLCRHMLPKLNEDGLEIASQLYASTVADRTANRRQTHNELQNKLNIQIGDVRLFEKGIKLLPNEVQPSLYKYLVKTLCTDIVSEILNYVAQEHNSSILTNNFNQDQRLKFVIDLPDEYKSSMLALVKSLTLQNLEEFMNCIDDALSACSMIIKKVDKKKDRTIVLNHKHELLEQLNICEDLALVLHLATLAIFTTATQCLLHASGRHVKDILSYLKQFLTPEQTKEFNSYHDYVTQMLSGGSEEENVREKLKEMVPGIKKIANEFKKLGSEKS